MKTFQIYNVHEKKDFPLLANHNSGNNQIIYLDHAATTQKPIQVLDKLNEYYKNFNANVHRGAHQLSAKATDEFEKARHQINNYINAYSDKAVSYTHLTLPTIE